MGAVRSVGAGGRPMCRKQARETPTVHVGSCQNYGPFLGTLKSRCRMIMGTQKGTIILTATHVLTLFAKCFAHVSGRNLWLWCVGSEPVVRAEDASIFNAN